MTYFRDNIDAMRAYVPGEQPDDAEAVCKLNTNENPYPPSPAAAEALQGFAAGLLRSYPDPMAGAFRKTAAKILGVPADWILPGNGSDDLIIMIARAATGPGRTVVYPAPTFPFYRTQAEIAGGRIVEVPCGEDFALPLDALAAAAGEVTFLAHPNSPTGAVAPIAALDRLAATLRGLLVIDEAYVDFAEESALGLVAKHENVIVLRTLSKGYSLAGLRFGFGVAQPAILENLLKTKAIYNVGAIPAAVATAAFADQDHHRRCVGKIVAERTRLADELVRRGLRVWASQANFLFAAVPGRDAAAACEALKTRRVLVRYFQGPGMDDKLRITVGTPEQNERLLAAWDAAVAEGQV